MHMEYTIVNLDEIKIEGVQARTKNSDPDMTKIIGSLWDKFYRDEIYKRIDNKANNKAVEVYSDYESDFNSEYSVTVGCEVKEFNENQKDIARKVIPAGKYAKFIVKGHMVKAVQEFWVKLWNNDLGLKRNYKCDFEEYQDDNIENATIYIYISID